MSTRTRDANEVARFDELQAATRRHRRHHGCNAYTFEDAAGLLTIARNERAARILELGTALGYTACVLATATDNTHVDTIENDVGHVALARHNIRDAGLENHITIRMGDFFEVMAELSGPYDLAFFDGLGPTATIVEQLRTLLRPNGLLVCANLEHATGTDRLSMGAAFEKSGLWKCVARIEGGGTLVFRKMEPGALPPSAPVINGGTHDQ